MATYTVNTSNDVVNSADSVLSLREAIARSNVNPGPDKIQFGSTLEGQTLVLNQGDLIITDDLSMGGDRNNDGLRVSLSGGNTSGILATYGTRENRIELSVSGMNFENSNTTAITAYNSDLTIDHARLSKNARAIYSNERGISVSRCQIVDNGGAVSGNYSSIYVEDSLISDNQGRGIITYGVVRVDRSTISNNNGGGILTFIYSGISVIDSTIAGNSSMYSGAGIVGTGPGRVTIQNSTITNNISTGQSLSGAGIYVPNDADASISNSIVAGNSVVGPGSFNADISGRLGFSNGHNIFGSDVAGNVAGDREGVAASTIFASVDSATGGGQLNASGVVPLKSGANPALGGASRDIAGSTDQLGNLRPLPGETSPDIGAFESSTQPSTAPTVNHDLITGTSKANTIDGLGGQDTIKGLGGADTLKGNTGDDRLEGGAGNDRLQGGTGSDVVSYRDNTTAVTVDLRGDGSAVLDTAKRGTETDTLTGVEGAVGGVGADRFFGDSADNWFQGGGGKDTFTGGAGRDTYVFSLTSASAVGNGRDVITDYAHLSDKIDLRAMDADTTQPGNQDFTWVDTAALAGHGELGYVISGGNTIIRLSTDADAASEGEIQLTGIKTLTALDFYL